MRLLQQHRKKLSADAVLDVLRAPGLELPESQSVTPFCLQTLLPVMRAIADQCDLTRARLTALLAEAGEAGAIIDSQPGIDVVIATTLLAEAPQALRNADEVALRTLSGTAPVTRRSGKSHRVTMRRACNLRLRNAVRNWAKTAIRCEARSRALYDALRARGHSYERALRGLADRLIHRLIACLRDGTRYDADRWNAPRAVSGT